MQGGRGEETADGNIAVRHVDVEFVPLPAGCMTFGIAFGSDVTDCREIRDHRIPRKPTVQLDLQPRRRLRARFPRVRPSLPTRVCPSSSLVS